MPISWIFHGRVDYCFFFFRGDTIFNTRLMTGLFLQSFYTMLIVGFFDVIEMLARNSINATGLRNVLEKSNKFDYSQFASTSLSLVVMITFFFRLVGELIQNVSDHSFFYQNVKSSSSRLTSSTSSRLILSFLPLVCNAVVFTS